MKKRLLTLMVCLPMLCSIAIARADQPSISAEPFGVRLNYDPKKEGVEVGVLLKLDGDGEERIKALGRFWLAKKEKMTFRDILLKDSNVKNLGSFTDIRVYDNWASSKNSAFCYYISFDAFPSPGSQWLHLKGDIPVRLLSEEFKTPPVPMLFEKGSEMQTGDFKVVIETVESKEGEKVADNLKYGIEIYALEDPGKYDIADYEGFILTDAEGNKIDYHFTFGNGMYTDDHGIWRGHCYYLTGSPPEEIYISVVYRTAREVIVPVDIKFDLYTFSEKK